jgi:hypothetical protein
MAATAPARCEPGKAPGGATLHDPKQAYKCYVLFAPMVATQELTAPTTSPAQESPEQKQLFPVYLINLEGHVVHTWQVPVIPIQGRLLPNGNVVVIGLDPSRNIMRPRDWIRNRMGGYIDHILELDWNGNIVFKYAGESMHGDCIKLDNGNYLFLKWELVPDALRHKVKGGLKDTEYTPPGVPPDIAKQDTAPGARRMFNETLVEVNAKGETVWSWHANDHLNPETDLIRPAYRREEWLHAGSIDEWKDNQILLTSRNTDSIYSIDKQTGEIKLRWGNHAPTDTATLSGPADARKIPDAYPGAGHILIYNALSPDSPEVIEFDPTGSKVAWQFSERRRDEAFRVAKAGAQFSPSMGNALRLPNGNTLICLGVTGRLFQVTPDKKTVWEYVNPYRDSKLFRGAVYRAHAYPPDFCPQFKTLPSASGGRCEVGWLVNSQTGK